MQKLSRIANEINFKIKCRKSPKYSTGMNIKAPEKFKMKDDDEPTTMQTRSTVEIWITSRTSVTF